VLIKRSNSRKNDGLVKFFMMRSRSPELSDSITPGVVAHRILRQSGETTQREGWEEDFDGGSEHQGQDAREADHKQHRPGETDICKHGTQVLPKIAQRTLQGFKPKVAIEKIGKRRVY
jgi:hypothetical protein